ncbi:peptide methionine sulfoxide reductase [Cochleicola gelatinilyticus]|nr:peptide methionine sulfoxide reductase [Cochleicola gelatinilyticus]
MKMMLPYLNSIPEGFCKGFYNKTPYRITKQIFNKGKSGKIFAEASDGSDFISLNYYITKRGFLLKPCEMASEKVVHFLRNITLCNETLSRENHLQK